MYHSMHHPFVMNSISRFINSHALIPNPFDDNYPMEAVRPFNVGYFQFIEPEHKTYIWLIYYLNGAVMKSHTLGYEIDYGLFIDKKVVDLWGYPSEYFDAANINTNPEGS